MASYDEAMQATASGAAATVDNASDVLSSNDAIPADILEILTAAAAANGDSMEMVGYSPDTVAEHIPEEVQTTPLLLQPATGVTDMNGEQAAQLVSMYNNVVVQDGMGLQVTLGADAATNMVVLSYGNNDITFETDSDVTVSTGGGANDQITTAGGNDNIVFKGGDGAAATINTGEGNDNVTLSGPGTVNLEAGAGDLVVALDPTQAVTATITAGEGFDRLDIVRTPGSGDLGFRTGHEFRFDHATGRFLMHSEGEIAMSGVQVVTFGPEGDEPLSQSDQITVLAETPENSIVAKLYQVALGRQAIDAGDDPLGGINFWMNQFDPNTDVPLMQQTVYSFLNCPEFHDQYDQMTDYQYVTHLFANLSAASGKSVSEVNDGHNTDYYLNQLAEGTMSREDVAWQIADSQVTYSLLGQDGNNYVIDAADWAWGGDNA